MDDFAARQRRQRRQRKAKAARHALVGPGGLWEMKRQFQFAFLVDRGLQASDTLLDLGCGTLRGGVPLIAYLDRGHYCGVDVRQSVLDEAQKELVQHGLECKDPRLLAASDLSRLDLDRSFSFAWSFSVLFHMTDDVLADALGFIARHMQEGGVFYANVSIGERQPDHWREFPVIWRSLEEYVHHARQQGFESVEDLGPLDSLGHVSGKPGHDTQRMLRFVL